MKSDREFLDGVYEKAANRETKKKQSYYPKRLFPIIGVAILFMIVLKGTSIEPAVVSQNSEYMRGATEESRVISGSIGDIDIEERHITIVTKEGDIDVDCINIADTSMEVFNTGERIAMVLMCARDKYYLMDYENDVYIYEKSDNNKDYYVSKSGMQLIIN